MRPLFTAVLALTVATPAFAAFSNPQLSGTPQKDGWADFNPTNFPGAGSFPGTGNWASPLQSNSGADAFITKTNGPSGGAFVASTSLYFYSGVQGSFEGATLRITDTTPAANLGVVVLQIAIGEADGLDFFNDILPVFNYNGGTQALPATTSSIFEREQIGTFESPVSGVEPLYKNSYSLVWDLSSIAAPINDFNVSFAANVHAQVYAIQLDQGAIPEPATASLAFPAAALLLRRRHR